jgi:hypothetical protein
VWGFVVGAVLLLAAAVVAGILVRVRREDLLPDGPGPAGGMDEAVETPELPELELTSASAEVSLVDADRSPLDTGGGRGW